MNESFVCVYKSGRDFEPWHVRRLRRQLPDSHDLLCLTDSPDEFNEDEGIVPIALRHDWDRWWSKMELYRDDLENLADKLVYLDLDTAIVGDVTFLFQSVHHIVTLSNFFYPDHLATGVVVYRPGSVNYLYDRFSSNPDAYRKAAGSFGDQKAVEILAEDAPRVQDIWPGKVVSYKEHCCRKRNGNDFVGVPENANVICFHGRPRPWEAGF